MLNVNGGLYNNLYRSAGTLNLLNKMGKSAFKSSSALGGAAANSSIADYYKSFENLKSTTTAGAMSYAQENAKNLSALKSSSYSLAGAARSLGATTLGSSDTNVATAEASYHSRNNGISYDVTVQNLAEAQQSASASFASAEASAFDAGFNSFAIDTDAGSHQIDFEVQAGDTNLDTLNAIAQSVNRSEAGVSAKVVTEDGQSHLQMTSNNTGQQAAFALSPVSGRTAAEKMEMQERKIATDANYTLNGQSFSSGSNTISLPDGRGATMTLQGTGSASLRQVVDSSGLVSAARSFAASYNTAVSYLAQNPNGGTGSMRALNMIGGAGNMASMGLSRLSAMGIGIDADGKMQVDAEKMQSAVAISPNSVRSALSGYGSVTDNIGQGADEAMSLPSASYTDFSSMRVENSLINTLMPQSGFLFDFSL